MTADELQQIATNLSGYGWCRYWLQWSYPSRSMMAVQVCQFRHDPYSDISRLVPIRVEALETLGFKQAEGFQYVYTIKRTHPDGTPYGADRENSAGRGDARPKSGE